MVSLGISPWACAGIPAVALSAISRPASGKSGFVRRLRPSEAGRACGKARWVVILFSSSFRENKICTAILAYFCPTWGQTIRGGVKKAILYSYLYTGILMLCHALDLRFLFGVRWLAAVGIVKAIIR